MLSETDRAISAFLSLPMETARHTWITRARIETGRIQDARKWMEENGFEVVTGQEGKLLTSDGRAIHYELGLAWALRPEVHTARLAEQFALQKEKEERLAAETKSVVGTESLSQLSCPKCGDALQYTAVCPKCAAGKLGYRHRYACICGGIDMVSKEAL